MPVYVISAGDTPMTKIGWAASDVAARVRVLQAGCWETLRVLRVIERGTLLTESWLHQEFQSHRVARDWFRFAPAMLTITPPITPRQAFPLPQPDALDPQPILAAVETFMEAAEMTATAFGIAALNDPTFVHEMRKGRECRRATKARVRDFIEARGCAVGPAA